MPGVDLQLDLDLVTEVLVHRLHHRPHLRSHGVGGCQRHHGTIDKPLSGFDLRHPVAELRRKELAQGAGFFLGKRLPFELGILQFDAGLRDGDQLLALELAERINHVFVHGISEVDHLEPPLAETFEIGTCLDLVTVVADDVVNRVLSILGSGKVIDQTRRLARIRHRALETQQLRKGIPVGEVGRDPLFDEAVELLVEGLPLLRISFRLLLEHLDHPLGDHGSDFPDQGAVLHRLARNIQRQVGAIDHSLHEPHPFRKQTLRFGVDQHFLAVEGNARLEFVHTEALHVFRRHEKQGVDRDRRVRGKVESELGLIESLGLELVERLVFLFGDLALVLEPERFDLIDPLSVDHDGEPDEVAVGLDEMFDSMILGILLLLFLELEDDLDAA